MFDCHTETWEGRHSLIGVHGVFVFRGLALLTCPPGVAVMPRICKIIMLLMRTLTSDATGFP